MISLTGRTVRESGAGCDGVVAVAGDGERITAAGVRMLIPLPTFPGRNPAICWRKSKWLIYCEDSAPGRTLTVPFSSNQK